MAEAFIDPLDGKLEAPVGAEPASPKPSGGKSSDRIVIKKYANRRLYNTGSSSYVTLDHLAEMVKKGVDFVVFDAKTNDDITRQVLTQIIFEAENTDQNLLPIQFLRQLIRLYGAQMKSFVPGYLEMSLDAFARQKDAMGDASGGPFTGAQAYRLIEDQVRQNVTLFGQAMKMFAPFGYPAAAEAAGKAATAPAPAEVAAQPVDSLADLKARMEEMQRQIERLASKS